MKSQTRTGKAKGLCGKNEQGRFGSNEVSVAGAGEDEKTRTARQPYAKPCTAVAGGETET